MNDPTSMTTLTLSAVPAEEAAPFYKDFIAAFPDGRASRTRTSILFEG